MATHNSPKTLICLACLLFTAAMFVYSGRIVGIDTEATFATSATFAEHGRWDMNIYASAIWSQRGAGAQGVVSPNSNVYSKKAPLVSIAHIPGTWLGGRLPYLNPKQGALLTIPVFFALSGVLMVVVSERFGLSSKLAMTGAFWWAFGTFALANTTEMFAEPIMAVGVLMAVCGLLGKELSRRDVAVAGVGCAIIILGNLASALLVLVIGVAFLLRLRHSRQVIQGAFIFAAPILIACFIIGAFNMMRTGSLLMSGYNIGGEEGFSTPLWVGLSGLLVTPYRGILWYAPISCLTLVGYWRTRRQPAASLMLILIFSQIIPYSLWWDWAGGFVWGPRFLLPVLPLIVILALPAIERMWTRTWGRRMVFVLAVLSVLIQIPGTLMHYSLYETFIRQTYPTATSHYIIGLQDRVVLLPQFSPIFGNLSYLATEDWWVVWDTSQFWWVGVSIGIGLISIAGLWRFGKERYVILVAIGIALYSGIAAPYAAAQLFTSEKQAPLQRFFQMYAHTKDVVLVNAMSATTFLDVPARPYTINIRSDAAIEDTLAQSMLSHTRQFDRIWFFTQNPGVNWIEASFWGEYFIGNNQYVADFRVVLVDRRNPLLPLQTVGVAFDTVTLETIAMAHVDEAVYVALDWSGTVPSGANMFIHVVDSDGFIVAQHDRLPLNGVLPLDRFSDKHVFPISNSHLAQDLQLRIGWADENGAIIRPDTGEEFLLLMVE